MRLYIILISIALVLNFKPLFAHSHKMDEKRYEGIEKYSHEILKVIDAGILHECVIDGFIRREILSHAVCALLVSLRAFSKLSNLELKNAFSYLKNDIEEILDHTCGFYAIGYLVKQEINVNQIALCALIYPFLKSYLIFSSEK